MDVIYNNMKKIVLILTSLIAFISFAPLALGLTKQFQYNPLGTLTTGLVSYYNMQGNSNDYWGTNNGSDTSITYGTAYGKVNEGANFNGSTSVIGLSNLPSGSTARSFAFWVYFNSVSTDQVIISADTGGTTRASFLFEMDAATAGKLYFETWGDDIASVATLSSGQWYFIVGTYDGNTNTSLYINGTLDTSHTLGGTLNTATSSYEIGNWTYASKPFSGDIDEVAVYSKALSSAEISELYRSGTGQTMCNGTGGPLCFHKVILISLNFKPEPIV